MNLIKFAVQVLSVQLSVTKKVSPPNEGSTYSTERYYRGKNNSGKYNFTNHLI